MNVGDLLELETEAGLAQGGEAVARAPDGRVLFVRGAAPSESVRARVIALDKRWGRAELDAVLRAGPARVDMLCPHADRCGGCPLAHLDVEAAAEAKLQAGLATLARIARVPPERLERAEPVWKQPFEGARSRARFAVQQGRVGFREARSHGVAVIEHCRTLEPALEAARVELMHTTGTGEISAVTDGEQVSLQSEPGLGLPETTARVHTDGRALEVRDPAGLRSVRPDLFQQAGHRGNAALLEWLADRLPSGDHALELYAGSGNFTRLLAARFERVTAVEAHREAAELGRSGSPPHVTWRIGDAGRTLKKLPAPDLVLVDPPRAGLDAAVRRYLQAVVPGEIWYVSCDVGTLARDTRALAEAGLQPDSIAAFDLYPGTAHLEWVLRFRPA